ncbi:hypothetical protein MAM1_0064d03913 [Mucor ambiguus]|uniref:3'-5' exonuclease domain-containing protein n=1 Tax=Mucor ambiguus TaxID=91626 RepID=A0A0C9MR24_9FUNG|nr:hypothetical protein MAM1_0064d03913 [Mucor ambiguus]
MASLTEDLDSDSSEEEWVIGAISDSKQKLKSTQHVPHQKHNAHNRSKPTLSAASFRMARAYLPASSKSFQPAAAASPCLSSTSSSSASPSTKSSSSASSLTSSTTAATSLPVNNTATSVAIVPSSTHISNEELVEICKKMDDTCLVNRLVNVYKSVEIYIRIREIETGSVIESRLKDYLHYCDDPCDFILNTLVTLSNYFADNSKNKDLTSKFRRLLASNLCSALAKFLITPLEQKIEQCKARLQPEQPQLQQTEDPSGEVDLISFADDDHDEKQNEDVDLISFDDVDPNPVAVDEQQYIGYDYDDDDDDVDYEDKDDDEEGHVITLAEMLGMPHDVFDRYTLTREHQLKLVRTIDTIPSPVVVYYAMDVFDLPALIAFGCELEDDGLKLCRSLMKHAYYDEAVATIRKLALFSRFPPDTTADHFFTAGHGMCLPSLYADHPDLQKQLLSFINKQLRFNYAGNLDVVPQIYLKDLFDGTDKTQQLSRLKERKFQKDLVNCAAKIMKELDIQSGDDYYFILLSQRYACLRYILAQRAIQQLEDDDTSIDASSNFNGLIDLVCQDDPVLARLAIKELIDTGDVVAPPYFASLYKQQEFYCRYNALPLNQRLLGVVKGEQLSRHRTQFSRKKPVKTQPENVYQLSAYVKRVLVDSEATLLQMKSILARTTVCGLDTEWVPTFAKTGTVKTALMQIASDIDGYVFLVDFKTIFEPQNACSYHLTEEILSRLFEDENIVKLAFDFSGDLDLLHQSMPSSKQWKIQKLVDLKNIKTLDGKAVAGGLAGVVNSFLNVSLNKRQQLSNWEKRPLTEEQIIYGACDACCLLDVYYVLCQRNHPFVKDLPRSSYLNNTQEQFSPSSLTIAHNASSFYQTPQSQPLPLSSFSPSASLLSSSPSSQRAPPS